ncbi:hypothetical protein ABT160_23690 [Streptomyces sp. NPDC001941]|uniref:hypothetical protein n=1 Tax=Streptomyces sp. NPDC001941 TaxID=3154659 RepID=UPI00331C097E
MEPRSIEERTLAAKDARRAMRQAAGSHRAAGRGQSHADYAAAEEKRDADVQAWRDHRSAVKERKAGKRRGWFAFWWSG